MAVLASNQPKTFTFNQTPSATNTKHILHARLCLILNETQKIRDSNKLIKKQGKVKLTVSDWVFFYSTSTDYSFQTCGTCINLPADEQCILYHSVSKQNDVDKLIGSIITCADVGDRVEPKKTVSFFKIPGNDY